MRIGFGVAVTGKVLQRGEHSAVVDTPDIGPHQRADGVRILAERARIDDRIQWIVVDIGIRSEIHVDADGAPLERSGGSDRIGVVRVPGGAGGHDRREAGRPDDAHRGAPLEVGRNEQRQLGA